ncbi:extensin-like domain-containing protein [Rhizobium sp.]
MGIDDDTTVSSIPSGRETNDTLAVDPIDTADSQRDYLDTPNLADTDTSARRTDQPLPKIDEEQTTEIPGNGVNMDQALGVDQPVGLAEEQARDIAEGNTEQPVVDGIGTDTLSEREPREIKQSRIVDFQEANTAGEITPPSRRRRTEQETEVALVPRMADPAREEVPLFNEMSAADRACLQDLQKMGVRFEPMQPISKGNACGVARPLNVIGFQGGVQLKPAATLNCQMARFMAKWVKNELVPSARTRYFSGIKTIHQLSSYSCRKMNSRSNNPWSEHAKGNALDIGGFTLKNGKTIDVRKKSFFAFREKGLLKTVREDSCKYFTTVLGPGDAYHGNHFHFDLRARKSGYRHCSL